MKEVDSTTWQSASIWMKKKNTWKKRYNRNKNHRKKSKYLIGGEWRVAWIQRSTSPTCNQEGQGIKVTEAIIVYEEKKYERGDFIEASKQAEMD